LFQTYRDPFYQHAKSYPNTPTHSRPGTPTDSRPGTPTDGNNSPRPGTPTATALQRKFKNLLLERDVRCVLCGHYDSLQAAHIISQKHIPNFFFPEGIHGYHPKNGILLDANCHGKFDSLSFSLYQDGDLWRIYWFKDEDKSRRERIYDINGRRIYGGEFTHKAQVFFRGDPETWPEPSFLYRHFFGALMHHFAAAADVDQDIVWEECEMVSPIPSHSLAKKLSVLLKNAQNECLKL
jgi:hypothetical protein